jgi:hypothetical protein
LQVVTTIHQPQAKIFALFSECPVAKSTHVIWEQGSRLLCP